eukprot:CAMPEP_0179264222 /NCGR_PEP_ID=MMETSP0797-20121207/28280_1 /TAXON_ID=47934 /ORGANISM="Dinophysis acuminata, Strain DAEP01" /LENGTH=414 /DNA_ID=CAMNT_0020972399 /DNA_START=7 /DNA_END=1251 /DNA_ORIENTATION=-
MTAPAQQPCGLCDEWGTSPLERWAAPGSRPSRGEGPEGVHRLERALVLVAASVEVSGVDEKPQGDQHGLPLGVLDRAEVDLVVADVVGDDKLHEVRDLLLEGADPVAALAVVHGEVDLAARPHRARADHPQLAAAARGVHHHVVARVPHAERHVAAGEGVGDGADELAGAAVRDLDHGAVEAAAGGLAVLVQVDEQLGPREVDLPEGVEAPVELARGVGMQLRVLAQDHDVYVDGAAVAHALAVEEVGLLHREEKRVPLRRLDNIFVRHLYLQVDADHLPYQARRRLQHVHLLLDLHPREPGEKLEGVHVLHHHLLRRTHGHGVPPHEWLLHHRLLHARNEWLLHGLLYGGLCRHQDVEHRARADTLRDLDLHQLPTRRAHLDDAALHGVHRALDLQRLHPCAIHPEAVGPGCA